MNHCKDAGLAPQDKTAGLSPEIGLAKAAMPHVQTGVRR